MKTEHSPSVIQTPFVMQMVAAANGEKVSHFRSIKEAKGGEVKIFYSSTKVFIAYFDRLRHLQKFQVRVRRNNESLLGIEGSIEDTLRREAIN